MTSFATHRLRVHDRSLPPYRRLSALRTCLTEFAPYGLRATYHHLCRSAGIPRRLEDEPAALVWAVDELHAARELWLAEYAGWQVNRRAQKAAGVRRPDPPEPLRSLPFPDPERHPADPLPVVMPRILGAARAPWGHCPLCGVDRGTAPVSDGFAAHLLCAGCGVSLGQRPARDDAVAAAWEARWKLLWRRAA